jgi:hypothetical protein
MLDGTPRDLLADYRILLVALEVETDEVIIQIPQVLNLFSMPATAGCKPRK